MPLRLGLRGPLAQRVVLQVGAPAADKHDRLPHRRLGALARGGPPGDLGVQVGVAAGPTAEAGVTVAGASALDGAGTTRDTTLITITTIIIIIITTDIHIIEAEEAQMRLLTEVIRTEEALTPEA